MINPTDGSVFPALQDLLSWTSKRQQALGANLANMDTPSYRAKDYSFDQELASIDLTASVDQIADEPAVIELSASELSEAAVAEPVFAWREYRPSSKCH